MPAPFAYLSREGSTFRVREHLFSRIKAIPEYLKTKPRSTGEYMSIVLGSTQQLEKIVQKRFIMSIPSPLLNCSRWAEI